MPVIPVTWKAETGGSQFEASLAVMGIPCLKSKQNKKNWGCGPEFDP
jgi:hypothetical protein